MFTRRKDDRLNLSKLFLSKQEQANQTEKTNNSPDYRRFSKSFLSLILIICTTTVAAFFVVNAKDESYEPKEKKVVSKRPASTSKENKIKHVAEKPAEKIAEVTAPVSETVENTDYPLLNADTADSEVAYEPISRKVEDQEVVKTQYKLRPGANMYQEPDASTKSTIINHVESFEPFNALAEENGFVYAVLLSSSGSRSEGWLRKKDVKSVKSIMHSGAIK